MGGQTVFDILRSVREYTHTVAIDAPCPRVWEALAELERWPEWTASVVEVKRLAEGALGTGTKVRIKQPRLPPAVWEITRWEPQRGFVWVSKGPGFSVVAEHWLAPKGDGCEAALTVRYDGPLGGLIGALSRGMTERYVPMEAVGLKARSEARP